MHPYSEKFAARDYFPEVKASLSERIRFHGLFSRGECIPIRRNSSPGIIFPRRMHPYLEKFVTRDYFSEANASLTSYFVESGCIPPSKCIPDRVFHQIRMHSSAENASLTGYFFKSGCIPPGSKWSSITNIPPENIFFLRITVFLPQNHFSAFTRSW